MDRLIITRLGIGIHHDDWYRSTLGLFEAITFPVARRAIMRSTIEGR